MEKREEFKKIAPEYFLQGMYVDTDVFYIQENRPVLFCKQEIITEDKINRLRRVVEQGASVYISAQGYERMMDQYQWFCDRNHANAELYQKARKELVKLYEAGKLTGKVEMEAAGKLADMIHESIDSKDFAFILQWISYMRGEDEYLYTHSVNVALLNGLMGKWLGMSHSEEKNIVLTGLLHDIGKTLIEEEVINKPGGLTQEEFEVVKQHPLFSWSMVKESGVSDENILRGVRGHHEKGNGNGYPDGLHLEEIPFFARITAISDIYDAMVAKRIYKDAKTPFEVLDEFYRNKFSDLDIRLVDVFLDKMVNEMTGRKVVLSDGRVAKIVFMEKNNFAYPVVQCEEGIIYTSEKLCCKSLCMDKD